MQIQNEMEMSQEQMFGTIRLQTSLHDRRMKKDFIEDMKGTLGIKRRF